MKRLLLTILWLAVFLLFVQTVYFLFFRVSTLRYNEGQPLQTVPVSARIHNITALYNDGAGTVWVGTDKTGLYRFDIQTQEALAVTVPHELKTADIRSIALDRQNRLWVGTANSGLFLRNGEEWRHYGFAARIPLIKIAEDGTVFLVSETGLTSYLPETDKWSDIEIRPAGEKSIGQISSLAFHSGKHIFVGTLCRGIIHLVQNENGGYTVLKHITAKRRFGPGSAPVVSPVPLDACGDGLPSNQVNALLSGSGGTLWAGTAAGLAWSQDNGETWHFLRGRDYGDKMRGLLTGTPYKWKEIPRVRFGELLPEDDISLLVEDTNRVLWMGTRMLGCVAVKSGSFQQERMPESDNTDSALTFLTALANASSRFYGTKTEQIAAMTSLPDGRVMLASRSGSLEIMTYPATTAEAKTILPQEQRETTNIFPKIKNTVEQKQESTEVEYPSCVFLADDYTTGRNWQEKYGKTYALIGGGKFPHDKLIAFDETLCKVRLFVGFAGNRTCPLERITLIAAHKHHHSEHSHEDKADEHHEPEHGKHQEHNEEALTAWSSSGSNLPKTYDGQHLWCEVKLTKPGQYQVGWYFVDLDSAARNRPRDYLLEVFPEISTSKVRAAKSNWQEPGRRADEWSAEQRPLAVSRVNDFSSGVYKRCLLTGPGTYLIKVDKNYSRKIDLCAVFIDRQNGETLPALPEKSEEQTADFIP